MEVTLGPRPTFCKLGRACAMGTSRMHRWNIFESKFAWAVAAACSALAGCSSEAPPAPPPAPEVRSEEHTSELQSLMRISYAVFCLKKKNIKHLTNLINTTHYRHHNSY